jgi:hypothetical protein
MAIPVLLHVQLLCHFSSMIVAAKYREASRTDLLTVESVKQYQRSDAVQMLQHDPDSALHRFHLGKISTDHPVVHSNEANLKA